MKDDIAFQSQQFVEQVAQRRDRYSAQNIDTFNKMPQAVDQFQQSYARAVQGRQQEEALQMEKSKTASSLANDELHRKQASEELQWAQALHQTDMLSLNKRGLEADINLKEAQSRRAIMDLDGSKQMEAGYAHMNPDEMDQFISAHKAWMNPYTGKMEKASNDMVQSADKRISGRLARELEIKTAPARIAAESREKIAANRARVDRPVQSQQQYDKQQASLEFSRASEALHAAVRNPDTTKIQQDRLQINYDSALGRLVRLSADDSKYVDPSATANKKTNSVEQSINDSLKILDEMGVKK